MAVLIPSPSAALCVLDLFLPWRLETCVHVDPGGCLGVDSLIPTCPAARSPSWGLSLSCPATAVEMLPELKLPALGTVGSLPLLSVEVPSLLLKHKSLVLSFVFVKGCVQTRDARARAGF